MNQVLLIAAGGGLGAVMRWWLAGLLSGGTGNASALSIFIVNVSGCFLIGLLQGFCYDRGEAWRLALITGVLGGYTTFSTFGWQIFAMLRAGHLGMAAANAAGSVVAGLVAVWAGVWMSGR
ncbi:MAG TPA: fluoride efflux transporter CrcB [Verrucomicrobiales bacterium]|jgi:CrcB protein|nr:fluoride efflux transporter CrcB [Verrucomicrobiales bacterium]